MRILQLTVGRSRTVTIALGVTVACLLAAVSVRAAEAPPNYVWAVGIGGNTNDTANAVLADGAGNVFVGGNFLGSARFGTSNVVASANGQDAFFAKFDGNGEFLSVTRIGGTGTDSINALAMDGASNLIVAGTFSGTLPMGTNLVSAGGSDCFVAVYNPAGALQWARRLGGTNLSDAGNGVAADALGNVFVVGNFGGTAPFGTNTLSSAGFNDGFVAKYDSAGTLQWARSMGGTTNDSASAVATDGAGGVVVVGSFRNSITVGTSNVSSAGFDDVYVVRFDANGDLIWLRQGGGGGSDFGLGVAVDAATNVFATGSIGGTAFFGSLSVSPAGGTDCFTVKYNAAGTPVWLQKGGGSSFDSGRAIAVNSAGEALVTGYYPTTATFGTSNILSAGTNDIFLVKYATNGSVLWAKGTGGALADQGNAITIDPQGYVVLAGIFRTNVVFDGITLTNATTNNNTASDGFVAKLFHTRATNVPAITQQPVSQTNFTGLNSTFSVGVSGTTPLYARWFFNGMPLAGQTSLSLVLTNLSAGDAGDYFVEVTNIFGAATSSVATLTVIAAVAPSITTDPTNLTIPVGWTAAFSVTAGGTPPFTYEWWFKGVPTTLSDPTNRMLTITNAQLTDAGNYFVIVSNQYGAATSAVAQLTVDPVSPPVITAVPKSATNYVGASATFSVQSVGASPLSYQWIKDGQPLPGANAASLTLSPLQTNDAGGYSVTVTNGDGATNSPTVQLLVLPVTWPWAVRGGGIYSDYAQSAAMDAFGNSYVAGYFLAASTYGSATLTNAGGVNSANGDLFIAKHDPQGNLVWIRRDGGPGYEQAFGMAVDGGGNVYVTGLYNSGAIIAGVPLFVTNGAGVFVAKYDPDGNGLWAYGFRGQPSALGRRVAADTVGNVYVTGTYRDSLVVDATTTLPGVGTNDTFLAKLSPSGQPLWARRIAGAGNDYAYGLDIDAAGNVYVGGYFTGATEVGTTNLLSNGGSDLFVAKYAPDGTPVWAQRAGGTGNDYLQGLAVDGAGGVCVGGYFTGTFEFGATNFSPVNSNGFVMNSFIARFNSNGEPEWARRIGSTSSAQVFGVSGDAAGNVVVGGTFTANVDLGSTNLATSFGNDAFLAGYDSTGTLISAAKANTRALIPYGLAVDPAGNAVICGWFTGTVNFDAVQLTSVSAGDIFAAYHLADRVPAPPTITAHPVGQTVFEGMRASLRVRAAGAVPLSFQWHREGVPVPGATNGLLTFTNAVAADAGSYTVLVSNALGSVLSTSAVLAVNPVEFPVTILTPPSDQTVALGGVAVLSVDAYGAPPLNYQWQFNGTNLAGATNAMLLLNPVATNQAGAYRVFVSNPYHGIYSSNAQLEVSVLLPAVTTQPQPLTIGAGSNATFSVVATGSPPLRYQWRFNGQPVAGATNAVFTLVDVQRANAGTYSVTVSNLAGAVDSHTAFLNVIPPPSVVRLLSSSTTSNLLFVPVQLTAQGGENAVGFSLQFDPAVIGFASAGRPAGVSGTLLVNSNQAASGRVGCVLSLPTEQAFIPGTRNIVIATFNVLTSNAMSSSILFSDVPSPREVSDAFAAPMPSVFVNGTVSVGTTNGFGDLEGDVAPRPGGNQQLSVSDWVQVGRFVAQIDFPTNAGEFARADCAPRATLGDGKLTVSDWVQAGRYAVGSDGPAAVGGPSNVVEGFVADGKAPVDSSEAGLPTRTIRVTGSTLQPGVTNSVAVWLDALGGENAVGFTLNFNPSLMRLAGVDAGAAVGEGTLNLATNSASGRLAVALARPASDHFAAGSHQLVVVRFFVAPEAFGPISLVFNDESVVREVADVDAGAVPTSFVDAMLNAWFSFDFTAAGYLNIDRSNDSVILSWPASAVELRLQTADAPAVAQSWTNVSSPTNLVGASNQVVLPFGPGPQFFRLLKP